MVTTPWVIMDEQPGLSSRYTKVSPWPIFIAFGIVISEIGILFNVLPVAVAGLVLLSGSIAGLAAESGYAATPWRALGVCAGVLVVLGGILFYVGSLPAAANTQIDERGIAILVTALLLSLGAVSGQYLLREEDQFL